MTKVISKKETKELTVYAPAKINLYLDVLNRRADGYHEIDTIMSPICLFDKITVQEKPGHGNIDVSCNIITIPQGQENIAYKSAEAIYQKLNKFDYDTKIIIEKRIPSDAGLAGGSADAAAVLRAINQINGTSLSNETLIKIGSTIGADVPFCIMNQTMRAYGIGEKMTPVSALPSCWFVIAKDGPGIQTKKAYQEIDKLNNNQSPNITQLLDALTSNHLQKIGKHVYNIFEEVIFPMRPAAAALKKFFVANNCLFSLMSGSGTAVYAAYNTEKEAVSVANKLKQKKCSEVFVCESMN